MSGLYKAALGERVWFRQMRLIQPIQDLTWYDSQFVSTWHGLVPCVSASRYVLRKSVYLGAQPSQAWPKRTVPVKRNSPSPGFTLHSCGIRSFPVQTFTRPPVCVNTSLFCLYTRDKVTPTDVWSSSSSTPRMLPRPTTHNHTTTRILIHCTPCSAIWLVHDWLSMTSVQ